MNMASRLHHKRLYRTVLSLIKMKNRASYCGIISHKCYRAFGSGLNRLSSSFASTAESSRTTVLKNDIPRIDIAVCVQRLPIITREKNELENLYEELQERLELEHSSLSDYEVFEIKMKTMREKLKHDEDNEELNKEVAALDSEYQELQDIEQQHIRDALLGSRRTEADERGEIHTPNRKLEEPLFLLTQNKETTKWQLPQGPVKPGETLRQAAERIIQDHVDVDVQFMSNAPSGVYRKAERDGMPANSPKVFFYQANLQGTMHKYPEETWTDSIWASKDELQKYFPQNYYQCVLKFLL